MRVVLNPGFEQELGRSRELGAALRTAAENIAEEARRAAPRAPSLQKGRRRHYADMLTGVSGLDDTGRQLGRVLALHFTSLWVEYGSVHNPPYAPLRRALDASRGRALP